MAISRSDINRALDDLVGQEEGMRFQALAVILAKKKWPELIACERRNDRGLDAYAARSLVPDRKGKGLASSITSTLDKIKEDATKTRTNFNDVDVLIFATTGKITNQTVQTWAEAIKKEFGYELIVMPREEIISSLLDPDNAALCSMIGIAVPPPAPGEADILSKARAAAAEEQTKWRSRVRGTGRPVIDLTAVEIDRDNNTTDVLIDGAQIRALLTESRRFVLEGWGGGGKTTMLVELAKSGPDSGELSFLVDLPSWVRSNQKILDYIVSAPSFQARGVTAADLAHLTGMVHVNFLLNGWNEVAETTSQEAIVALAELERDFPASGILIATRTHFVGPPLPGAVRARLLELTRRQRAAYIRASIQDRSSELLQQIDGSKSLDSLTRLPLILAEVTTLFASGRPIPTTRVGVLGAAISLAEESPEHRSRLQTAPLFNRANAILRDLAAGMMDRGEVEIAEDDAIDLIASASEGRGAGIPKPDIPALLRALCAHHVLELTGGNPAAYRFQHQQYQEFYAAAAAAARLASLPAGSADITSDFSLICVNRPLWEEPLRMVAEDIASRSEAGNKQAVDLGAILVGIAIKIDPLFGAHLARLAGKDVWARVGDEVRAILREWYAVSDRHHRQCALAAMFATGSGDFADIIVSLLTDKDRQTCLRAYNTAEEFCPTSLGDDWKTVVAGWDEGARVDFVGEAAHRNRMIDIGQDFAVHDPSAAVRLRAVQALSWAGATDALARVLGALDVEALKPLVPVLLFETVPEAERPRIVAANRSLLSNEATPLGRIRILLRGIELGDESVSADLKRQLEDPALKVDQNSEHTIHQAVLAVGKSERQWASDWAISRMIAGEVSGRSWTSSVSPQPERKLEELVDKLAAGELLRSGAHPAGAFGEMVMAQGLGDEDRQAPRVKEGDRGAGTPAGRDHAPHLG